MNMTAVPFLHFPYGRKVIRGRPSDSPQWNSKDLKNTCDPMGWAAWLTFNYGFEFVVLPDRVLQFFEWGHTWRDIWTDGRKLPPNPPIQRYLGYAVGRWEGDTFVVESNGYDDSLGLRKLRPSGLERETGVAYPHSDEMRIEKRYKRIRLRIASGNADGYGPKRYI